MTMRLLFVVLDCITWALPLAAVMWLMSWWHRKYRRSAQTFAVMPLMRDGSQRMFPSNFVVGNGHDLFRFVCPTDNCSFQRFVIHPESKDFEILGVTLTLGNRPNEGIELRFKRPEPATTFVDGWVRSDSALPQDPGIFQGLELKKGYVIELSVHNPNPTSKEFLARVVLKVPTELARRKRALFAFGTQ